jgi:alpha-beta hydrolase superfamily lysophospholipase
VFSQNDDRDLVVLVHGLGRTRWSMVALAFTLRRAGFRVLNWGYSSTRFKVGELGKQLQDCVRLKRGPASRVHFVGHSLGNIIVRWALTQGARPAGVGRIVMIAPPNQGARAADRFAPWLGRWLVPLPEIGTDPLLSTAVRLPVPDQVEVGVIAGSRDGKVSVAETHLAGEADHITVAAAHTFVMFRPDVRRQTVQFLREGRFRS